MSPLAALRPALAGLLEFDFCRGTLASAPHATRIPGMEAERVNAVTNKLADLEQRIGDLRRYL